MSDFDLVCACCALTLVSATNSNIGAWRSIANSGGLVCQTCGCQLRIPSTPENVVCVGPPEATSIDVSSGSVTGGTTVALTGHGFDLGNLQILFGDKPGTNIRNVTSTSVMVDTPSSSAKLNTQGLVRRKLLTAGVTGGPLQVNDVLTGSTSSKTAVVREVDGDDTFVYVDTWDGEFTDGEGLTSSLSGATATAGEFKGVFQNSETLTGLASGDNSSLISPNSSPFNAQGFSGNYSAGEWVIGLESEAKIQLAASGHWDSPTVDVIVRNQYGQRLAGSTLLSAFTYQ